MYCEKCKKEFSDSAKFCPVCGGPLTQSAEDAPAARRRRRTRVIVIAVAVFVIVILLAVAGALALRNLRQNAREETKPTETTEQTEEASSETKEETTEPETEETREAATRPSKEPQRSEREPDWVWWEEVPEFPANAPADAYVIYEDSRGRLWLSAIETDVTAYAKENVLVWDDGIWLDGTARLASCTQYYESEDGSSWEEYAESDRYIAFDAAAVWASNLDICRGDGTVLLARDTYRRTTLSDEPGESEESKADEESLAFAGDYLLPQSNQRLLTEQDIEGMTAQEINYAKNEIYARHGRRFQSQELQNYFDSKPWYEGTIAPEAFDIGVFSDVEQKNVEFLQAAETALGGYSPK